jgi:predicted RNase H-like HicB family nuclease
MTFRKTDSNHRLDSRDATLYGYSEGNPIMSIQPYTVEAFWDTEAAVWVATSETILGLVTEAETIEDLTQKLRSMIPDLLELNHLADFNAVKSIEIELITHRNEQIQIAA